MELTQPHIGFLQRSGLNEHWLRALPGLMRLERGLAQFVGEPILVMLESERPTEYDKDDNIVRICSTRRRYYLGTVLEDALQLDPHAPMLSIRTDGYASMIDEPGVPSDAERLVGDIRFGQRDAALLNLLLSFPEMADVRILAQGTQPQRCLILIGKDAIGEAIEKNPEYMVIRAALADALSAPPKSRRAPV